MIKQLINILGTSSLRRLIYCILLIGSQIASSMETTIEVGDRFSQSRSSQKQIAAPTEQSRLFNFDEHISDEHKKSICSCFAIASGAFLLTSQGFAPILTGLSHYNQDMALYSSLLTTAACFGVLVGDHSKAKYVTGPLLAAAAICSWAYWGLWHQSNTQIEGLWIGSTVMTTIVPIITLSVIAHQLYMK